MNGDNQRRYEPTIEPKFKCGECGEVWDDEDDARECCAPDVDEVYECPICLVHHESERQAIDCCDYDPDKPVPPSAADLEAHGQQRLIP